MKTNGNEVLKFVYKNRIANKSEEETFNEITTRFPKCKDMRIEDVKDMYRQIDLVNQDEFQDGRKYSIETIEIKEKVTVQSIIQNAKEKVKNKIKSIHKEKKNIEKKEKKNHHLNILKGKRKFINKLFHSIMI